MPEYYSKARPWWHWVLIYLVIGGVIYALVYYFVLAKQDGYTVPTDQSGSPTYTVPESGSSSANPY